MNDSSVIIEWQRLAGLDMATAHHMFDTYHPIPIEIVCFHSQQAAEKMLKCFLISKSIEPPRTHDLQVLIELCIEIESEFNNIYREASLLTRYSVIPRYPAELELIEQDAKTAIEFAEIVTNFINELFNK